MATKFFSARRITTLKGWATKPKQKILLLQIKNEHLEKKVALLEEQAERTQVNMNMALHPGLRSY